MNAILCPGASRLLLALVILALVTTACSRPTNTPPPDSTPTPTGATRTPTRTTPTARPSATPTATPTPTPTNTPTPIPEWYTGERLTIKVVRIERAGEVRYKDGSNHYLLKPQQEGNELIAVSLDIRNTRSGIVSVPIEPANLRLVDATGAEYPAVNPLSGQRVTTEGHPLENKFLPFLWGTVQLPQNCAPPGGTPQPCRLAGWVIFEVTPGRTLDRLVWRAGDNVTVPLSHLTVNIDPSLKLLSTLASIASGVAPVRKLDFNSSVVPVPVTRDEVRRLLEEGAQRYGTIKAIVDSRELYVALGLVPENMNLAATLVDLLAERPLGFFDLDSQRLYLSVETEDLTTLDQLTLAREYARALQQQHFDVSTLLQRIGGQGDKERAARALAEGDATFAQLLYGLGLDFRPEDVLQVNPLKDLPAFQLLPEVVQQELLFPYNEGFDFVSFLYERSNSWELVNRAYTELPLSTEQVLHPQLYLNGETPLYVALPDLSPFLGQGWNTAAGGVMGEFLLRAYLASRLDITSAGAAAGGWGGDRFLVMRGPQGQRVLVLLTRWDSPAEADEFYQSYLQFTDLAGSWQQRQVGATEARWSKGSQNIFLSLKDSDILLVLSPSQAELEAVLAAFPDF